MNNHEPYWVIADRKHKTELAARIRAELQGYGDAIRRTDPQWTGGVIYAAGELVGMLRQLEAEGY